MAKWADDIVVTLQFSGLVVMSIHLDLKAFSVPRLHSSDVAAVTSMNPSVATFLFESYFIKNWIPQPRLWDHGLIIEKQQERK